MLKLIKYELKAMGRILLPLYLLLLGAALALGVTVRTSLSNNAAASLLIQRFTVILEFVYFAVILLTGIIMVILIIQRFYRNLLGTEGYLMFTLPVTTAQHIWSKAITAFIWMILGLVTGLVSGFIMISVGIDVNSFFEMREEVWEQISMLIGTDGFSLAITLLILTMIASAFSGLMQIYAGFAIGHLWNDHRILGSVLAFIAFFFLQILFSLTGLQGAMGEVFDSIPALGNHGLGDMTASLVVTVLQMILYYTVSWYILDRKLNLE